MENQESQDVINLLVQLLHTALGVRTSALSSESYDLKDIDFSLRRTLTPDSDFSEVFKRIFFYAEERCIYCITDHFYSQYLVIRLPKDMQTECILVGPYLTEEVEETSYHQIISRNHLTMEALPALKQYYQNLPILESTRIAASLNLIASYLYPEHEDLVIKQVSEDWTEQTNVWTYIADSEHAFAVNITEKRYAAENDFLDAITLGNQTLALKRYEAFISFPIAPRYKDPMRDGKNLAITLNTLLRKAAEKGVVHPIYLDEISHHYAIMIENSTSKTQLDNLHLEMIRKYCILVKNQSLKNYPPLIRDILNHINLNLSSELNLKSLALHFNVNASYLSAIFKRETESTLTDYINGRRIDTALKILNTTDIRIQDIAYYVGIDDVNYFTRIFKKKIGSSPTEYKKMVRTNPQKAI